MLNEANIDNARYGSYKNFIDFKGLINLVFREKDPNQLEKQGKRDALFFPIKNFPIKIFPMFPNFLQKKHKNKWR